MQNDDSLRRLSTEIRESFSALPAARRSEMVLLEVDPEWVHLYWHIREQDVIRTRTGTEAPKVVLRLHDLSYFDLSGANPHATLEMPVVEFGARHYLHVPGGDKSLVAEIGVLVPYRRLRSIVRSQAVRLPPRPIQARRVKRALPNVREFPLVHAPFSGDTVQHPYLFMDNPSSASVLQPVFSTVFSTRHDDLARPGMAYRE